VWTVDEFQIKKARVSGLFLRLFALLCPVNIRGMKPIILVGMMGAGKSTVGRRLATRLNIDFVDSDHELELRCGAPISTIFELEGEASFRKRETLVIVDLLARSSVVVGTGGGAVLGELNRQAMTDRGTVVYLRAQIADLWHRTKRDKRRPLLRSVDPRKRLEELLDSRRALYESVAHHTVDTGRQPVDLVVNAIVQKLNLQDSLG
jgi:shikimate kinase